MLSKEEMLIKLDGVFNVLEMLYDSEISLENIKGYPDGISYGMESIGISKQELMDLHKKLLNLRSCILYSKDIEESK